MANGFGPVQWFDWNAAHRKDGTSLPHLEQSGAVYFITFRLWDSLPEGVYLQLQSQRDAYLAQHPLPHSAQQALAFKRLYTLPLERFMDQGHGQCILKSPGFRDELHDILMEFEGETYELGDFVIMPNHVHILMRTRRLNTMRRICRRWKNLSARAFNQSLQRRGRIWQPDSFDHIVRSPQHLLQCSQYIRMNPRNLPPDHYTLSHGQLLITPDGTVH